MQRLSRLVDGLLTLSGADGAEPPRRPADVAKLIEDRCDAWSALAEERQVDLVADHHGSGHPVVQLVPGDLDQILDNLLANALDASPEGSRIQVELISAEPGWMEVHVSDEGPGMSDDDRRRAFDRFWQGAGTTGGHSGLGLAIVRQLALRNDASVELRPAQPTGLVAVIRMAATHRLEAKATTRPTRDTRFARR